MSCRQSSRKVKLTSKFEEFTSARLTSIQRQAHPEVRPVTPAPNHQTPDHQPPIHQTPDHQPPKHQTPKHQAPKLQTPKYQTPSTTPILVQATPLPKLTANGKVRGRPRKTAETCVKPVSSSREELIRLREENASLRIQLEQKTSEFEELVRQSSYTGQTVPKGDYEDLQRELASAKRREWCYLCLRPSRYYCCWNTTYCSQKCQITDWYQRHMKSCERNKFRPAIQQAMIKT